MGAKRHRGQLVGSEQPPGSRSAHLKDKGSKLELVYKATASITASEVRKWFAWKNGSSVATAEKREPGFRTQVTWSLGWNSGSKLGLEPRSTQFPSLGSSQIQGQAQNLVQGCPGFTPLFFCSEIRGECLVLLFRFLCSFFEKFRMSREAETNSMLPHSFLVFGVHFSKIRGGES